MGLFGKKKVKVEELAPRYVSTIYEVVEAGFSEIAGYINEEKEFEKSPKLSDKENEWFLYIVYAGNLINVESYFDKKQADEINVVLSREVIKAMGKDPDIAIEILNDYEAFLRTLLGEPKNIVKAMSLAIFHKYDLNRYQKEHFQKLNSPSPIVMKELTELVEFFLWNWTDYLNKYKVIV
jgi:hypothetical protein